MRPNSRQISQTRDQNPSPYPEPFNEGVRSRLLASETTEIPTSRSEGGKNENRVIGPSLTVMIDAGGCLVGGGGHWCEAAIPPDPPTHDQKPTLHWECVLTIHCVLDKSGTAVGIQSTEGKKKYEQLAVGLVRFHQKLSALSSPFAPSGGNWGGRHTMSPTFTSALVWSSRHPLKRMISPVRRLAAGDAM